MNTPPNRNPAEILIAEDSPTQTEKLKYILEENDFRVVTACNGVKALEAMRTRKPTLVITDINMPEMDGYELCRRIRADEQLGDLPVILLTSLSDPEDVFKGLECGADNFITKPYDENNLLARIQYLLANVHLRKREKAQTSMEVFLAGRTHVITSDRAQILNLLLSTYEAAVQKNRELAGARDELATLNGQLEGKVMEITVANQALQRAIEDLQQSRDALKTAHLQLIQAEKMETVGRMAAGVAHEVRNPLQILLMSLDYLSQRMAETHDAILDGVIGDMRHAARRADTIICGLLDFSHSDALELKPEDLNALINKAVLLIRHNLAKNHVSLKTDLDKRIPPVALDGVKIEQVLLNLFTNAIDAMPKGGALAVKTSTQKVAETHRDPGSREAGHFYAGDTVVVVDVEDTGSGITPEALCKIFDPFFTTKMTGKGTGLGLTIVKRILDLHGGTIEIRNRQAGGTHCQIMFKAQNVNQN
jgi:two-component system sensor histidine kinase/response regulator